MRLFHLDSERGFRGGERQILYLAAHLRRAGHENVVACRKGHALDREAARRGFARLHLPFLGEWDPVSAWRLHRAAARTGEPSMLHAHTGHTALLASMASRLGGHPWVAHRRVDFRLSGALSRRFKYDAAGAVIAVSESIKEVLVSCGVAARKIEVVRDCLPTNEEEAAAAGAPLLLPPSRVGKARARERISRELGVCAEGPWILNLAALVGHKDHATLIRAAASVLRRRPDAVFLILGEGPLRDELEDLIGKLGVGKSVRLAGFRRDGTDWLDAGDAYVQSSWGEGMGSVLLEAMAKGLPIAATRAGGIPEAAEDGRTALLAPPRNPEALATAILDILASPEEAARRAREARDSLRAFSLTRAGEKTEGIYRRLLSAGPRTPRETATR